MDFVKEMPVSAVEIAAQKRSIACAKCKRKFACNLDKYYIKSDDVMECWSCASQRL